MKGYLDLLRHVVDNGKDHEDRKGVRTRAVFGCQWRHNLQAGFPLLTTRTIHARSVLHELLWMLRGETNVRSLHEVGVTVWDKAADAAGDLGPSYGKQWRSWNEKPKPAADGGIPKKAGLDQIASLVRSLKERPFSPWHIVTAWNPSDVTHMALPPCHALWQCQVETMPTDVNRCVFRLSFA